MDMITGLPRGLGELFRDILDRLKDADRKMAKAILSVIVFSPRPLDLQEIVEAIAISPQTKSQKDLQTNMLRRPSDVFVLCGSLIHQSQSTGKISLLHLSVKEFLLSPTCDDGRPNEFCLEEVDGLQRQLTACIAYLQLQDLATEEFQKTLQLAQDTDHADSSIEPLYAFSFLEFAADHWPSYMKRLKKIGAQQKTLLDNFFFGERGNFDSWVLICQYIHGKTRFPVGMKPIHAAILHDLPGLALYMIKADAGCVNDTTHDGRTPLHIALENGKEKLFRFLLKKGARLCAADSQGRTPLHAAFQAGNDHAVIELVMAGADINARDPEGSTPLFIAIEN